MILLYTPAVFVNFDVICWLWMEGEEAKVKFTWDEEFFKFFFLKLGAYSKAWTKNKQPKVEGKRWDGESWSRPLLDERANSTIGEWVAIQLQNSGIGDVALNMPRHWFPGVLKLNSDSPDVFCSRKRASCSVVAC